MYQYRLLISLAVRPWSTARRRAGVADDSQQVTGDGGYDCDPLVYEDIQYPEDSDMAEKLALSTDTPQFIVAHGICSSQ